MNFSSSIISGIGISLGGMDTAIDFLYSNAELYESELTEQKPITPCINNKKQKPIKPKLSKDNIISKFSLVEQTDSDTHDTIIESDFVSKSEDDFDYTFEETQNTVEDSKNNITEEAEIANDLLQRLSVSEENIQLEAEDTDNIDIEDEELYLDIDEDSLFEDDEDEENNNNLIDDIDNLDIEDEDDNTIGSIDDIDIDDNEDDINDDIEIEDDDEIEIEDDNELNIEDDIEIEEDDDGIEIEDDDIEIEDDELFDIENNTEENSNITNNTNNQQSNSIQNTNSIKNKIITDDKSYEIEQLKKKMAAMEREMADIQNGNAINKASNSLDDKIKKDSDDTIDELINKNKSSLKNNATDKYEAYSNMSIESLYKEVKIYMMKLGVSHKTVDIITLNNKFGDINIKKLIQKSYLIKIGKGVTTGR